MADAYKSRNVKFKSCASIETNTLSWDLNRQPRQGFIVLLAQSALYIKEA